MLTRLSDTLSRLTSNDKRVKRRINRCHVFTSTSQDNSSPEPARSKSTRFSATEPSRARREIDKQNQDGNQIRGGQATTAV
ncbi:Uncharacterized protein HZ326_19515 [Fusarium oxysporum f. sp. albedinis]|nr:Uncharacterized protein HZ326_19515 [Fusarium oxysporum f. sp. albedinis]